MTEVELADAITEADAIGPPVEPWYPGKWVDHLYPHCPGLSRLKDSFRPPVGRGAIYPEADNGQTICGWCLRVWRNR
jgi:hypothetical protein